MSRTPYDSAQLGDFVCKFKTRVKYKNYCSTLLFFSTGTHYDGNTGDAHHFNKPKWIKQNRKYPADPPTELRAYRDSLYEIPQKYQHQVIPEPTFNIIEFTELKLPGTTSTLIEHAATNVSSSIPYPAHQHL